MSKPTVVYSCALIIALIAPAQGQQQAPGPAEKAAAEKAMDDAAKRGAEMAEAMARAQQKVAEEAARASEQKARDYQAQAREVTPIDLEVTIARYQGDKKVSSLPYALVINAASALVELNGAPTSSIRMGGRVPVPTMAPALAPDGKPLSGLPTGGGPVSYEEVGTDIDARGRSLGNGRFDIWVSVRERAIVMPQTTTTGTLPVIRSFKVSNNMLLRDGQTRQFTAAADRVTGEVVRVDVKLSVVK